MERLMLVMWVVTGCSARAPTGGGGGGGGGGAGGAGGGGRGAAARGGEGGVGGVRQERWVGGRVGATHVGRVGGDRRQRAGADGRGGGRGRGRRRLDPDRWSRPV